MRKSAAGFSVCLIKADALVWLVLVLSSSLQFNCSSGSVGSPHDALVDVEVYSDARPGTSSIPGGWGIGCPVKDAAGGSWCGCISDFDDAILLKVGNSPVVWTEWSSGESPLADLGSVKWTVELDGWKGADLLLLEVPLIRSSDPVARRMVRLPAAGTTAHVTLDLLSKDGTSVATGTWSRELEGGRGWDLVWAWELGSSPLGQGVHGVYNWVKFDPRQPLCLDGIDECLHLWIGWYVRDPLGDDCIDASEFRLEAVDGQSMDDALFAVKQSLACCDALQVSMGVDSFGAPAEWVTVHVPDPAMYLGTEFHLYCEWEAGAAIRLPDHVTFCSY